MKKNVSLYDMEIAGVWVNIGRYIFFALSCYRPIADCADCVVVPQPSDQFFLLQVPKRILWEKD
ncbi:MAG TPA: hypothetical protein VFI06_03090 [Chitinophagaceae bacterium]|nr:hypothetical protein [Chitinophagaceae bacterium]